MDLVSTSWDHLNDLSDGYYTAQMGSFTAIINGNSDIPFENCAFLDTAAKQVCSLSGFELQLDGSLYKPCFEIVSKTLFKRTLYFAERLLYSPQMQNLLHDTELSDGPLYINHAGSRLIMGDIMEDPAAADAFWQQSYFSEVWDTLPTSIQSLWFRQMSVPGFYLSEKNPNPAFFVEALSADHQDLFLQKSLVEFYKLGSDEMISFFRNRKLIRTQFPSPKDSEKSVEIMDSFQTAISQFSGTKNLELFWGPFSIKTTVSNINIPCGSCAARSSSRAWLGPVITNLDKSNLPLSFDSCGLIRFGKEENIAIIPYQALRFVKDKSGKILWSSNLIP